MRDDLGSGFAGTAVVVTVDAVGHGNRFVPRVTRYHEDGHTVLQLPRDASVAQRVRRQVLDPQSLHRRAVLRDQRLGVGATPLRLLRERAQLGPRADVLTTLERRSRRGERVEAPQRRLPCLLVEVGRPDRRVVAGVEQTRPLDEKDPAAPGFAPGC